MLNKSSDALSTPDEKNKLNRFIVICGESGRGFEMKADTPLQKTEWLLAIKKVRTSKSHLDICMESLYLFGEKKFSVKYYVFYRY